jgi:peptidoglycan/LPS O-acetylase OafA/YrhL
VDAVPRSSRATDFRPLRDHISALDGLRGLAVLLILWHHLPDDLFGPILEGVKFVLRPGYLGVDVFFVLSGFLITRILLFDRAAGKSLAGFLKRRLVRIFPVYYLTVLVVGLWRPGAYIGWCATYLCNFFYSVDKSPSPLEHTWSLAVEEHFYLVWPFVVYALTPARLERWTRWGVLPIALGLAIATAAIDPGLPADADGFIYRITWYRAFSLALGGLIALQEARLREAPRRLLRTAIAMGVPGVLLLGTLLQVDHQWIGPILLVGFALFSGAIVLTTIWAHETGGLARRLLELSGLRDVGRFSYGLYLFHVPLYFAFGVMGRPPGEHAGLLAAAAAVASAFILASLSYRFLERPLLVWAGSSTKPRGRTDSSNRALRRDARPAPQTAP